MRLTLLEEYAKHSALNLGQVAHGLRYFYSHPDMDRLAPRGSLGHFRRSLQLRVTRAGNDFFYALIPPHWHHSPEELRTMHRVSLKKWFSLGYAQWRYTETGETRTDPENADPRWDARCADAGTDAGNT